MLWDHRAAHNSFAGIVLQEYCNEQKKLIGPRKNIFLGTPLKSTEGPHVYKRNGYYYLMLAEGGTRYEHAVSMARSTSIDGPYETDPLNPMLTSAGRRELPLQKSGHGCLVETQNAEWALVHLVGRPVAEDRCILGRETAVQKVVWTEDGWLRLAEGGNAPQSEVRTFNLPEYPFKPEPETDHFTDKELSVHWSTLRLPQDESWLTLTERPGFLRLRGRESLSSLHRQTLVARRQQSMYCEAETELEFAPEHQQQMAGLILYYDTRDYVYMRVSRDEQLGKCLGIVSSVNGKWTEYPETEISIEGSESCRLKVIIEGSQAQFYYSLDQGAWSPLGMGINILHLSDEAGEFLKFTGNFIGMCVQDLSGTGQAADFDYFRYSEQRQP
ncbi:Beta-xylosidase [compost metagenome]